MRNKILAIICLVTLLTVPLVFAGYYDGYFNRVLVKGFADMPEISAPGNPDSNAGRLYVADNAATTTLYFLDSAGTATNLLTSSGVADLNEAYDGGAAITVDAGAVTLNGSHATNNTLAIAKTTGSGNSIDITNAGTGYDIDGTSSTWYVTKTGSAVFSALVPGTLDLTATSLPGASPLILEGATANAYETSIAVTDPTADRTVTLPNESGNVLLFANANTQDQNIIFEGATADAFEATLAVTDPTADNTITIPDESGNMILFANANTQDEDIIFEGATADAFETTLAITDPTADRTVTVPNGSGTIIVSSLGTNAPDAANAVTGTTNGMLFEGATADAHETTLSPVDPTADRTITLPNGSGCAMLSSLATNVADAANAVTGGTNAVVMEGATADDFETSISPTDATADRTITLPDASGYVMVSSLATNAPDIANSTWGASNAYVMEGATADAFETSISPTDPTADRTITLPDATGTVEITTKVVTDDADGKTVGAGEADSINTNTGAVGGGIWALPEASTVIGKVFMFTVLAAQNMDINPDDADQILGLTNAAGDAIRNATAGGTVTLMAVDATNWVVLSDYGTWSDVN